MFPDVKEVSGCEEKGTESQRNVPKRKEKKGKINEKQGEGKGR